MPLLLKKSLNETLYFWLTMADDPFCGIPGCLYERGGGKQNCYSVASTENDGHENDVVYLLFG